VQQLTSAALVVC